jgi:transcriptional regulator with XRE-family HTH domain
METLRELRKDRGLTLEAVAYLAEIDIATVSRIERGLVTPRRRSVVRLARALQISVARMSSILGDESCANGR